MLVGTDLVTGLRHLWKSSDIAADGLRLTLHAYEHRVLVDLAEHRDEELVALCDRLGGSGVPDLERARVLQRSEPLRAAFTALVADPTVETATAFLDMVSLEAPVEPAEVVAAMAVAAERAALIEGSEPEFDPRWAAVAAFGNLAGHDAVVDLHPEELGFADADAWSLALEVIGERSAEFAEWADLGTEAALRSLLTPLVEDPQVMRLLRVHEHEGMTWFDRDGYRTLARAVVLSVEAPSEETMAVWSQLEERAGYRVDRLIAPAR